MIDIISASWKEFQGPLSRLDRVWCQERQEGLDMDRAYKNNMVGKVKYIFVREDGWSIGSTKEGFTDCKALWEDEWMHIYSLEE